MKLIIEFLKPSLQKILLFVIILIVSNIPFLGTTFVEKQSPECLAVIGAQCKTCPPDCIYVHELSFIFWPAFNFLGRNFLLIYFSAETEFSISFIPLLNLINVKYIIPLLFNFLYFYILSCLIVWIYNKVKR
jgi:hypothetical protein